MKRYGLNEKLTNDMQAESCPFLAGWFNKKARQIRKRKNWEKDLLALFLAFRRRTTIKEFAKAFELNYGTIRNWARTDGVQLEKAKFLAGFVDDFLGELTARSGRERENLFYEGPFTQSLVREFEHYPKNIRNGTLGVLSLPPHRGLVQDYPEALVGLLYAHAGQLDENSRNINEGVVRERGQDWIEWLKTYSVCWEDELKELKLDPEVHEKMRPILDFYKYCVTNLTERVIDLQVAYINKGKRRRKEQGESAA